MNLKSQIVIVTLVMALCALIFTDAPIAAQETGNASLIKQYETSVNSGDVDAVMAVFAPNAAFESVGQGILEGDAAIRAIHEYSITQAVSLSFHDCVGNTNRITCQAVEDNNWLRSARLGPIVYPEVVFVFNGDQIERIVRTMASESGQAMNDVLTHLVPWIISNHPQQAEQLFSAEGAFIYNRENAEVVLELLDEWRETEDALALPELDEADPLTYVQRYQALENRHDVDAIMALLSEDAGFELVGQGTLTGEAIRAIHDYDDAIQSRLSFIDCTVEGVVVTCQTVEGNDWLAAAGLPPARYIASVFTIEDGAIRQISAAMSPESAAGIGETLQAFVPWIIENHPEAAAQLFTAEGAFVYSYENGELVVSLLHDWQAAMAE